MTVTLQDILAAFGAIACIGGGIAYLVKLFTWLKKPNTLQNAIIEEHEDILKRHTQYLDNDNKRLAELEDQNRLVMQALLALLSHGIDGNDINAMKESKSQIQEYLIQK